MLKRGDLNGGASWTVVDSNLMAGWSYKAMGSENVIVVFRSIFPWSLRLRVFDVLQHLVTYLWTKRYKCCIKSANYVMLTYVQCIVGLL